MATKKTTPAPQVLTDAQKKDAVTLFKRGHERYTDLTKELNKMYGKGSNIPYQAVNTFMTKWKRREGIIQKRAERSDKKRPSAPSLNNNSGLPDILMEELRMLRNFYDKFKNSVGGNAHA